MTGRQRSPIVIALLVALVLGGLIGAWWFRGSSKPPATVAKIDRAALEASDPIAQWWTSREFPEVATAEPSGSVIFDAVVFPSLGPRVSDIWGQIRRDESALVATLPESAGPAPVDSALRAELKSLMTDFARRTAAFDLINAQHYRSAIDDWWAPYPQAQVFPRLAGAYRQTLLAELPREEITPTHLQMGDVMAQRQRRLGWAAQADVDAVAAALRIRLDAERATFEAAFGTELDAHLRSLAAQAPAHAGRGLDVPRTILSIPQRGASPQLWSEFAEIVSQHAEQMHPETSRDLMATSAEESQALQELWESYTALRVRRIDASLRAQNLRDGSGPDMTGHVAQQLFPESVEAVEEATP